MNTEIGTIVIVLGNQNCLGIVRTNHGFNVNVEVVNFDGSFTVPKKDVIPLFQIENSEDLKTIDRGRNAESIGQILEKYFQQLLQLNDRLSDVLLEASKRLSDTTYEHALSWEDF